MIGYITIPYVIAFANELVDDPIHFEPHRREGALRLAYKTSRQSDRIDGILRARVLDLRDRPDDVRGPERMKKLNTLRQWRCMDAMRCQVCGQPAVDVESGRVSWLLTETVFEATGADSGRTNAPPTCAGCVDDALKQCPMLQDNATLFTVAAAMPAGVLADLYRPGRDLTPVLYGHNVFVPWNSGPAAHLRGALATCQVVHLHGMKAVT